MESEQAEGRPITAHMLVTGHVMLNHPLLEDLRRVAQEKLESPPAYRPIQLTSELYMALARCEDALDMAGSHPNTALMIMGLAVHDLLVYRMMAEGRFIPRDKDLPVLIEALDPALGDLFNQFWSPALPAERLEVGARIAEHVSGRRGFFEWESQPEPCDGG